MPQIAKPKPQTTHTAAKKPPVVAKKSSVAAKKAPEATQKAAVKIVGRRSRSGTLSRAQLVGKYPEIQHQPAPKARHLLTEEERNNMVARMVLV